MAIIAPSVLSIDFSRLSESMKELNASEAKWIHFDVMDGHFVPNITFGPDVLKGFRALSDNVIDVHLMIDDPVKYSPSFIKAGADLITFHSECFDHSRDMIAFVESLHEQGVKAGITSKPSTHISDYREVLEHIDLVLVMSVEPGFGGQSFQMEALDKIREFKRLKEEFGYSYLIEVDGGINQETAQLVLQAGADVLVAGSYVFKGDIVKQVESLWKL